MDRRFRNLKFSRMYGPVLSVRRSPAKSLTFMLLCDKKITSHVGSIYVGNFAVISLNLKLIKKILNDQSFKIDPRVFHEIHRVLPSRSKKNALLNKNPRQITRHGQK